MMNEPINFQLTAITIDIKGEKRQQKAVQGIRSISVTDCSSARHPLKPFSTADATNQPTITNDFSRGGGGGSCPLSVFRTQYILPISE